MTPGEKLTRLLDENKGKITQLAVAEALGRDYQYVQKLRRGEIRIRPHHALILGEVFGVSPQLFLTEEDINKLSEVVNGEYYKEIQMTRYVLEAGVDLSDLLRSNILTLYKTIVDQKNREREAHESKGIPFTKRQETTPTTDTSPEEKPSAEMPLKKPEI